MMAATAYEARRRRFEWPASVRLDPEIKALDEENGEWILCRTCAEHYERTQRGRKPNDPLGFKVKMNGRFQEAAWVMHKGRVVAHRSQSEDIEGPAELPTSGKGSRELETRHSPVKRPRTESSEEEVGVAHETNGNATGERQLMHLPTTGWRCPGIVPDAFYNEHMGLIHAFGKYFVGGYRVNVVRDIRSDKVMLFSHNCENRVVLRELPSRHDCCEKCYDIWLNNKSFKRILKKMDRYALVEGILRHSWSISAEELTILSNFKHSSDMNLNVEGRRLKQAAMTAVQHFGDFAKVLPSRNGTGRTSTPACRNERLERAEQPLSMEVMLQLQSFDPSVPDGEGTAGVPEELNTHEGNMQQPPSPNEYLAHQNAPGTHVDGQVPND